MGREASKQCGLSGFGIKEISTSNKECNIKTFKKIDVTLNIVEYSPNCHLLRQLYNVFLRPFHNQCYILETYQGVPLKNVEKRGEEVPQKPRARVNIYMD